MAPPPPPSFSSFPDLAAERPLPPPPTHPPPSSLSAASHSSRPITKVADASLQFLDSVADEYTGHSRDQSSHKSRSSAGTSKDKGKERERHTRSDEKRNKKSSKHHREERNEEGRDRKRKQADVEVTQSVAKVASVPRVYTVDTKGDSYNLQYGGLHQGDIPRHRRIGAGKVVGLNSGLRITKESAYTGRGLEVVAHTKYHTPRYVDSRSVRHLNDQQFKRVILTQSQATAVDAEDLFLPTSADPSRYVPLLNEAPPLSELDFVEGQDYRALDIPTLQEDYVDEDIFGAGEGGESNVAYLKRRNVELDQTLRNEPSNVKAWLEFIEFQDEFNALAFPSTSGGKSTPSARTTTEIKLSILQRALSYSDNITSLPLLLLKFDLISILESPEKVLKTWKETLVEQPRSMELWKAYVDWRQSDWSTFEIRAMADVFRECLEVLGREARSEKPGTSARVSLEMGIVNILQRLALFFRQAGFPERALALYQATLELNLFRPVSLASPILGEPEMSWRERVLEGLEEFWDDELPRIGEVGAQGWATALSSSISVTTQSAVPPVLTPTDMADPYCRWAATEQLTTAAQSRPARTTDEGIDDDVDPFRVVLFDDLKDFLPQLFFQPAALQAVVYGFFNFLGVPAAAQGSSNKGETFIDSEMSERDSLRDRFWLSENAVAEESEWSQRFEVVDGEPMDLTRSSKLTEPFSIPLCKMSGGLETLFQSKERWFARYKKEELVGVDTDMVRCLFTQLSPALKDTFFDLNAIAFEACLSPKAAIKLAKQTLRFERENLLLWSAYARIERQRGNIEAARTVYVTALSMYKSFTQNEQDASSEAAGLWRAWSEMEWEEGRRGLALRVLVAGAVVESGEVLDLSILPTSDESERPPASQILRARAYYTTLLEAAFQQSPGGALLHDRNHYAASFSLFEYLATGLAPAVSVLEQHLSRLEAEAEDECHSVEYEEALVILVKLLYRHSTMQVTVYRPGQLRDVLEKAIRQFPENSIFLNCFYVNELRMKIQNRVRRTLELAILPDKAVTSNGYLFAIFAESHMSSHATNLFGVRGLFDRAVENPRTRASASIWSLYIDFELRNADLKRAKALVYRAIRAVPWCKELYLKPFMQPLRSLYTSSELKEFHSLLLEKGLRVCIDLDDVVGGWKSDVGMDLLDNDDENDRLIDSMGVGEELLEERKRLMPY